MISAVQRYTGRLEIPCTSKFIDKWAKLVRFGFIYEPIAGYLLSMKRVIMFVSVDRSTSAAANIHTLGIVSSMIHTGERILSSLH